MQRVQSQARKALVQSQARKTLVLALAASVSFLIACGGGGGSASGVAGSGGVPGVNGAGTPTIVNFTDSPSDRVVAFELTINSVSLKRADGSTLSLLSTPRRVEVTHVSGSAHPLVLPAIPEGTFVSAAIVVSAPDVAFIDNAGREIEKKDAAATSTLNVPFTPALQVGNTPLVLTLDFNAAGSISIDAITGNVSVTPVASMSASMVPGASGEDQEEVENGEFEHIVGQVTASSASSFTITLQSGIALTFAANSGTAFEGAAGAANLATNSTVRVEGITQQDGSLLAKEVEVLSASGTEAEGLITSTTGNPVTAFSAVVQDGSGGGMDSSSLGTVMLVTISNNTKFRVDAGKIDLSGLNLPNFSAASLSKGQRVEAESDNAASASTLTAGSVKLQEQALIGAVSAITGSQFTLTVPDDSAFKLLTGKGTMKVFTQKNMVMANNAAITQGAVIKVRGLVFFDPSQGTYTLVAGRITTP